MRILAIETSCDETAISILETKNNQYKILADLVSSQMKIHAPFGGVVPSLARREHQKNLTPLLIEAMEKANLLKKNQELKIKNYDSKFKILNSILEREPNLLKDLTKFLKSCEAPDIDYIAVTVGPGLEPALWTGVNFAKAIGYVWKKPIVPINHIEAHIAANWLKNNILRQTQDIKMPAICLVVSGGHTQLILMNDFGPPTGGYKILGETRDDAAGEAFDKVAKLLNLGYPGGPIIAVRAARITNHESQIMNFELPRPMINQKNYDFSFSGLKTAVLYLVKEKYLQPNKKGRPKLKITKNELNALCAEFQQAVIDVLISKTLHAAKTFNARSVIVSGGVAANDELREQFVAATRKAKINLFLPEKKYCTDNAVMIALAAYYALNLSKNKKSKLKSWKQIKAEANLRIR